MTNNFKPNKGGYRQPQLSPKNGKQRSRQKRTPFIR